MILFMIVLEIIAALILILVLFCLMVCALLRLSAPCRRGIALAQKSSGLKRVLGEPIRAGWLVGGRVETATYAGGHSMGTASLRVPLRGPRANATLLVLARKDLGQWNLQLAHVIAPGVHIELLSEDQRCQGAMLRTRHPQEKC